jgi:tripartite-type tricarboxylate transporter receptor subunit TctC
MFAPAGTPAEIISRLNRETRAALDSADVQARMAEFGLEIYRNSPEEFADVVKTDLAKMARLVKQAGIEPQ